MVSHSDRNFPPGAFFRPR
ncbi:TPA_asm: US9 uoORF [Human alphaherpesvirus 1]|nr:TPA_asm: US9 uoORF [Human alphaherpesvirus 1]